jgi:hypothetical protein
VAKEALMQYQYKKDQFGENNENTTSRSITVKLTGQLTFEETDLGPAVKDLAPNGGDSDFEKFVTVTDQDLEKLVVELVRDKFADSYGFRDWTDTRGIQSSIQVW